jgi:hypothetical protein
MTEERNGNNKSKKNNSELITNFDRVVNLIREITGGNLQSVITPLQLFEYAGDVQKAVFLSRLIFLSDKGKRKDGFIWKTYADWKMEIGLSQSQVERIVSDFQERKIIEAKKMMASSKNSNASSTWHYRLLTNKFLADFKEFLMVRTREKSEFQPEESLGSVTDSSIIKREKKMEEKKALYKTPDPSLNQEIEDQEKEKEKVIEENYNEDITSEVDFLDSEITAEDFKYSNSQLRKFSKSISESTEPQTSALSTNFKPSLKNRIVAIESYPYKSPKLVTKKFIDFYTSGKGKNTKKLPFQWDDEWLNWMGKEISYGVSRDSLEEEHLEIMNEFRASIFNFIDNCEEYLVNEWRIFEEFCDLKKFSRRIVEEYLDMNSRLGNTDKFFDSYYVLLSYNTSPEFAEEVDKEMDEHIRNYRNDTKSREIFIFIKSNVAVTEKQIQENFSDVSHSSISNLLRVCVKYQKLTKVGDYYHEHFNSILHNRELSTEEKDELLNTRKSEIESIVSESMKIEEYA